VAQLNSTVQTVGKVIRESKLNVKDETGLTALDRLLTKQLTDKNVDVRFKAAKSLGDRSVKGAAGALATLISSDMFDFGASTGGLGVNLDSDSSKDEALKGLLKIDRAAAEKALIAGLNSTNAYTAAWAANEIGRHSLRGAVPALVKAVSSNRWEIANTGLFGRKTFLLDGQKVIGLSVLVELDRAAAEEALIAAAESDNDSVRTWATESLTTLATAQ